MNTLKYILPIVLIIFLSFAPIFGQSDVIPIPSEYEVYQQGVKVKYDISTKSIFVKVRAGLSIEQKNNIIQSIKKYLDPQKPIREEDTQNGIWILNLSPRMDMATVQTLLRQLKINPLVSVANPFIIQKGEKNLESEIGISHQLYVKLGKGMTVADLRAFATQSGVYIEGTYPYDEEIYILSILESSPKNTLQIANEWAETGRFEVVRPNFYVRIKWAGTVNDPLSTFQWALKNNGAFTLPSQAPYYALFATPYANFTAGADMKVNDAWDIGTGTGIRVALFDDGTQRNHPDLSGNMIAGLGYDPTDNTNLGDLKPASTGHGTATAGVIAAVGNNNIGIAGVAYNAKLIPVNLTTGLETLIAQSYDWAWQTANADVICSAWNYTNTLFDSPIINAALQRAFTQGRGGKGCVLLFPSGNAGLSFAQAPANLNQVISVSASTSDDLKANFSSAGRFSDIAAPGSNIVTTDITGAGGFNNADYVSYDGSSIAVAQVAGIAALVLGVNPNLTATQVRQILQGTAEKVGGYTYTASNPNAKSPQTSSWSFEMGYGRVNAFNAVRVASNQRLCNALTTFTAPSGYFDDGNALQGYANNTDCSWLIQPQGASQITLNFLDFKLADSNDQILVYSGSDVNSTLIGSYSSGNVLPISVSSPTGMMLVRFVTDDKGTDRGWRATYSSDTPNADFAVSNTVPCLNTPINVTVNNPTGNILSYQWNFGEGANPASLTTVNTAPIPVSYQSAGLKTITLTLVGATGNVTIQKTNLITVAPNALGVVNEGFESSLPPNWRIVNVNSLGKTWERRQATLTGGFGESNAAMYFNNLEETQNGVEDYLLLPTVSFANFLNPTLTFDVAYSALATATANTGNDRLRLEYSLDCGMTWVTVYNKSALGTGNALIGGRLGTTVSANIGFFPNSCSEWRRENITFPTLAGNSSVLFRFANVSSGGGNNLYLDNVKFTQGITTPSQLVSTSVGATQINLSWTDNATNETGYVIERSAVEPIFPNPTSFVQVGQVSANVTTFTDTNLSENATYWYRISAIQPNGAIDAYNGECPLAITTVSAGLNTLLSQNFNSCTLPVGWVNNDLFFNGDTWAANNSRITTVQDGALVGYGALASPASGCFLVFDSDKTSNDFIDENIAFQSPVVNTVGSSTVLLRFDQLFIAGLGAQVFVEVSTNGILWNQVATYTKTIGTIGVGGNNSIPRTTTLDVSQFLANNATARFRFRWTGNRSFAWAIDNVALLGTFGAPSNLTASSISETQIRLTWRDNTINEGGFSVERSSTSATSGFTLIDPAVPSATGAGSTVIYNDNSAIAGVSYWYRVRAFVGVTNSSYSNVAQTSTIIPPINLAATALSSSSIRLNWVENSINETGFVLERALTNNGTFTSITTLPSNATTFTDAGLTENTTYFYRIRALAGALSSSYSNIANATTLALSPTNLTANATNDNAINLQWTDNATNESGYVVERSLSALSGFVTIANLPASTTNYADIGLSSDTRYYYRVAVLDLNANLSSRTNTANDLTFPARPTNLRASATDNNTIALQWTDNATTETGYVVERGLNLSNFAVIATLEPNQTNYQDKPLQAGQQYFYRVRAIRGAISSRFSTTTNTVTLGSTAPEPPILTAKAGSRSVLLTWEAASDERNISYYEIYVLSSNNPLRLVGNSSEKRFLVTGLENAVTYTFRVVAVGNAGQSSGFSNPVTARPSIILGVEDLDNELIFNIYPNPNAGDFKIQFADKGVKNFHLRLTNSLGQVVFQKNIQQTGGFEETWTLNQIVSGIYLLTVETQNGVWKKQISVVK